ncbi:Protein of unknown function [Geodermatophilus aquaeductus]|uniref:DUF3105 domain-containing protein n=1 Tax=Geodermatophilus aquaeductus TaxID=1564161 RepID=A0A521EKT6_9ACTN|nr:Protein of unknown function [Geodermatophilus aquaeductus]
MLRHDRRTHHSTSTEEKHVAKDPKPDAGRAGGGSSRSGSGARPVSTTKGSSSRGPAPRTGGRGRTRPPTQVVTHSRPWGLIAAAVAVVVFAAAAITYAVVQVRAADAERVDALDEIAGIESFDYAAGQEHVTTPVEYDQTPPVGGPHDGEWADCTGTVYDVDVRHENAVHSMEHGAVWIAYNPDEVTGDDVAKLAELVDGVSGRLLSPYAGLDSAVSLQSWNHQLKVDSVDDPRIEQFADFLTFNGEVEGAYPEIGASCENPTFVADPLVAGDGSRGADATTDAPTTPTMGADGSTETTTE